MAARAYPKVTVGRYCLEVVSAIHDSLYCSMCGRVLSDPRFTPCGCRFCSECIREHLGSATRRCPGGTDKCVDLQYNSDVKVDLVAATEVGKLYAKCPFESCGGAFEVGQIKSHLDAEEIKESHLHQEEVSPGRKTTCEYCGRSLGSLAMSADHYSFDHADLCDKYEDYCPCACGVTEKVLWKAHSRTCEANKVPCPYERLGCATTCSKADMSHHFVEDAYRHTEVLLKHMDNLNNELTVVRLRPPTVVTEDRVQGDWSSVANSTMSEDLQDQVSAIRVHLENNVDNFSFYCGEFCWKMTNYRLFPSNLRRSRCFYTHRGYHMQMEITTGNVNGFLSVYTKLARGRYDNELEWPFKSMVTVRILDQERRGRVYAQSIYYGDSPNKCHRRPHRFNQAYGWPCFICINELRSKPHLLDGGCIWIDCFVDE